MAKGKKEKREKDYVCGTCGRTSERQDDCCGQQMKPRQSQTTGGRG